MVQNCGLHLGRGRKMMMMMMMLMMIAMISVGYQKFSYFGVYTTPKYLAFAFCD